MTAAAAHSGPVSRGRALRGVAAGAGVAGSGAGAGAGAGRRGAGACGCAGRIMVSALGAIGRCGPGCPGLAGLRGVRGGGTIRDEPRLICSVCDGACGWSGVGGSSE